MKGNTSRNNLGTIATSAQPVQFFCYTNMSRTYQNGYLQNIHIINMLLQGAVIIIDAFQHIGKLQQYIRDFQ